MAGLVLPLLFAAIGLFAVSGVPSPRAGRVLALLAGLSGLASAVLAFLVETPPSLDLPWPVPIGRFSVRVDALSAAFLVPVSLVPALGTVYASAYVSPSHPAALRMRLAYGLLPAAMALVVVATDALLLLMAWEVMALSAFLLVTADDHEPEVRDSGWTYLVATHLGTLALVAGFAILASYTGSLALLPVRGLPEGALTAVSLLLLTGFGLKAGLMPLHVWLPGAHANAPSHVSAVMSGVVLKMGVYGLVRSASLLDDLPASAGTTLLALGAVSAVLAAALAMAQADMKRLLAYSSVDHMGIVAIALGLAVTGRALDRPDLLVLGLAGATLHAWNHALFKPLLFFVAGAVVHATGTRRIDLLGGLSRTMPRTASFAFLGASALAALPPLNGFASEILVYTGLLRSAEGPTLSALAAPALAASGALAVVAMVKLHGFVFLGEPRRADPSHAAPHPGDPPRAMRLPMAVLAVATVLVPLALRGLAPALDRAASTFAGLPLPSVLVFLPLGTISLVLAGLLAALLLAHALFRSRVASRPLAEGPHIGTWDCGYAAPTPRIQYTGTSFSQLPLGLFARLLAPKRRLPDLAGAVLPAPTTFSEALPDPVLDRAALPSFRLAGRVLPWIRLTQQGNVHVYLLYILVVALVLLLQVPGAP